MPLKQTTSRPQTFPHVIRPEWTAYGLAVFLSVVPLLWLWLALSGRPGTWSGVWASLALPLGWALFIGAFAITLTNTTMQYRQLGGRWEVRYTAIRRLETQVGRHRGGFFQLLVHAADSAQPHCLNLKPFSARDLALVVETIATRNPSVKLTPVVQSLRAGDVRPLVKQALWRPFLKAAAFLFVLMLILSLFHHFFRQ